MRAHSTRRPARIAVLLLGLVFGAAAGAAGVLYWKSNGGSNTSNSAGQMDIPTQKIALGRIEPADGILDILGPTGDTILALGDVNDKGEPTGTAPREGANVAEKEVLFTLKSWEIRREELVVAALQLAEAKDRLKVIEGSGKAQLTVAEAKLEQARTAQKTEPAIQESNLELLKASAELADKNATAMRGSGSPRMLVEAEELKASKLRTELANAKKQIEIGKQTLAQTVNMAEANIALANSELVRAKAEVPVKLLEQKVESAKKALDLTKLKAPKAGKLIKLNAKPGMAITVLPLAQIADLSSLVVVAEVYETDVKDLRDRLAKGPVKVKAVSPALSGSKYNRDKPAESEGAVSGSVTLEGVGGQIARNRVFDLNPAADIDRRVVEVRAKLDNPGAAANFLNLQVMVYFDLK